MKDVTQNALEIPEQTAKLVEAIEGDVEGRLGEAIQIVGRKRLDSLRQQRPMIAERMVGFDDSLLSSAMIVINPQINVVLGVERNRVGQPSATGDKQVRLLEIDDADIDRVFGDFGIRNVDEQVQWLSEQPEPGAFIHIAEDDRAREIEIYGFSEKDVGSVGFADGRVLDTGRSICFHDRFKFRLGSGLAPVTINMPPGLADQFKFHVEGADPVWLIPISTANACLLQDAAV